MRSWARPRWRQVARCSSWSDDFNRDAAGLRADQGGVAGRFGGATTTAQGDFVVLGFVLIVIVGKVRAAKIARRRHRGSRLGLLAEKDLDEARIDTELGQHGRRIVRHPT